MKTIPTNRSSLLTSFFVVGGLLAFYFYRKNGGKISPLIQRGTGIARTVSDAISEVAPAVGSIAGGSRATTGAVSASNQI